MNSPLRTIPSLALIEAVSAELADFREDDQAFWDSLDGETDVLDVLDYLIEGTLEDAAMVEAIEARMAEIAARKLRVQERGKARRRAIARILQATGMKKAERPLATISLRAPSARVEVDEAELPSQLMREKIMRQPDLVAIRAQLDQGETVPGARLVYGDAGIQMRVK